VADDLLSRLDSAFAKPRAALRHRAAAQRAPEKHGAPAPPLRERWSWPTIFIAIQFLWGALLFLPGSQAYRPIVRALPYACSAGLLLIYLPIIKRSRGPRGTVLLVLALALLVANLLHPTSQLAAGIAQCVFQFTIAAPMFWGWKAITSPDRLKRLLWMAFAFNTLGAVLGVLQVYFPDRFMPSQFSSQGMKMNDMYVESLTYIGPDGTPIVRPPGLTDQPGGAAISGALTVVLGAGMTLIARTPTTQLLSTAAVGVGLAAIYLTQVRSLLLMSVGAVAVLAAVMFRRGQAVRATRIAVTAAVLVVGAFIWARALGGQSVEDRFVGITKDGAVRSYQDNRGGFVAQTFGELLDEYPLGAGLGRWGMMLVYFGDPTREPPPIHVEIQPTGWLLDGGIPMWILYGGAIFQSLFAAYRLSVRRGNPALSDIATITLLLQVLIFGFGWAGPVFNTQLGLLFWFVTSALHGAATDQAQSQQQAAA
jgi:hypothetical protein